MIDPQKPQRPPSQQQEPGKVYQALAERLFTADANVRNVRCFFSVHRAKCGLQIALPRPVSPGAAGA